MPAGDHHLHPSVARSTLRGRPGIPTNTFFYDRIGVFYDVLVGPVTDGFRRKAVAALALPPDGRLLIAGIGTGLDLTYLPPGTKGVGIDLSESMLRRARRRRSELGLRDFELRRMDAQALEFPDESFDAVYLPLIVAVATDGAQVLAEAERVAKPGARIVVVDKFWPEGLVRTASVRWLSGLIGTFVTHVDRRFSEIHAGAPHLRVLRDEPVLLSGFFRRITLQKPARL